MKAKQKKRKRLLKQSLKDQPFRSEEEADKEVFRKFYNLMKHENLTNEQWFNYAVLKAAYTANIFRNNQESVDRSRIFLSEHENEYVYVIGKAVMAREFTRAKVGKKNKVKTVKTERLLLAEPRMITSGFRQIRSVDDLTSYYQSGLREFDSHIWLTMSDITSQSGFALHEGESVLLKARVTAYKSKTREYGQPRMKHGLKDIEVLDVFYDRTDMLDKSQTFKFEKLPDDVAMQLKNYIVVDYTRDAGAIAHKCEHIPAHRSYLSFAYRNPTQHAQTYSFGGYDVTDLSRFLKAYFLNNDKFFARRYALYKAPMMSPGSVVANYDTDGGEFRMSTRHLKTINNPFAPQFTLFFNDALSDEERRTIAEIITSKHEIPAKDGSGESKTLYFVHDDILDYGKPF